MEYNNIEIAVVREVVAQAPELELQELNELQLMLVGGGCADIVVQ